MARALQQGGQSGSFGAGAGKGGPGGGGGAGGGGGGHPGGGHGPSATEISDWIDTVLAAGTLTADTHEQAHLSRVADHLTEIITDGGETLPLQFSKELNGFIQALAKIGRSGDSDAPGEAGTWADTAMSSVIYKVEEFIDANAAYLSGDLQAVLTSTLETLETAYADLTLSTEEQSSIATAATTLRTALRADGVKLSDAGIALITEWAADAEELATTGTLTLTDDMRAALETANTALDALDLSTAARWQVGEILTELKYDIGGHLLGLAHEPPGSLSLTGVSDGSATTDLTL